MPKIGPCAERLFCLFSFPSISSVLHRDPLPFLFFCISNRGMTMVRWSPRMLFQVTVEETCPAQGATGLCSSRGNLCKPVQLWQFGTRWKDNRLWL